MIRKSASKQGTLPFAPRRTSSTTSPSKKRRVASHVSEYDSDEEQDSYEDIQLSDFEDEDREDNYRHKHDSKSVKVVKQESRQLKPLPAKFAAATKARTPEKSELKIEDSRWSKVLQLSQKQRDYLTPIHSEDQNKIHHILHTFDMTEEYGPCMGVSRLERWERANKFGLNPPHEIQEILLTKQGKEQEHSQSVLHAQDLVKDQ